ncbi:hypothetical protein GQ457_14G004640 [Hibiscus cannabinus]
MFQADKADREREAKAPGQSLGGLHGIPILLKDNIATNDKMNTTAGSLALLRSIASLSEWAHFRGYYTPGGWCARTGQGKNPYNISERPCGSSSGAAIAAAATLGTETDGSILCPSNNNSVVGIKPTVGLTSRAGVIPISPRQDTVGNEFFNVGEGSIYAEAFERHFSTLRQRGAVLVENVNASKYLAAYSTSTDYETLATIAEFKLAINSYLKELVVSPVRSLKDLIAFNNKFSRLEKTKEYGQEYFLDAEATNGIGEKEKEAIVKLGVSRN